MATDNLSFETIERIHRLNACLAKSAKWVEKRARRTQAAYFAGGGKTCWGQQGELREDYELEAVVKCSLGSDDPAFNPNDEYGNIIAATTTNLKHKLPNDSDALMWSTRCDDYGRYSDALKKTQLCYLFHEIWEHILHYDLESILKIGEVEINLVLWRQRGIYLDTALLPRKRKNSYPRSIFSRTPDSLKHSPLTHQELRYAHLLNQKMSETRLWIDEQSCRCEKEYADIVELDAHITEDDTYEDYEIMMRVVGCLGENHPEYKEDDDNVVATVEEQIYKESQRICGRARNPFHHSRYGAYFAQRWLLTGAEIYNFYPCGLFFDIFKKVDRDWLKMLSIGRLWLDVYFVQRRIVRV